MGRRGMLVFLAVLVLAVGMTVAVALYYQQAQNRPVERGAAVVSHGSMDMEEAEAVEAGEAAEDAEDAETGVEPKAAAGKKGNQTRCPTMGCAIDRNVYWDYEGKRIYFCCPHCREEVQADPEKYLAKMRAEGVVLEDAPAPPGEG